MIRKILALCSRDCGHEEVNSRLNRALVVFTVRGLSWDLLIYEAEKQGVAPLLYKHISSVGFEIPESSRRLLQSLYLRNRRSNAIRNRAIVEVLRAYDLEKIEVLLVKGIALCNFAYSETGLRPMRDIDLLLKKEDLPRAEAILFEQGYLPEDNGDIPDDYYHLVPLRKSIAGLPITLELHSNLLPFHPQYPLWPFEKSFHSACEFEINGTRALTLSLEDTLWYVYLHGFQAPLTYEPFRLMHVADMVSLVENFFDTINWEQIQKKSPTLLNVIALLHSLTPLQQYVSEHLKLDLREQPVGYGLPYTGWPQRKIRKVKKTELASLAKETFWPSPWWLQMYYGYQRGPEYLKARFFHHPRAVWRWAKTYLYSCFCGNLYFYVAVDCYVQIGDIS